MGRVFRAPDVNIALMQEWESKLEQMAESMMDENVTNLARVPSWMLVLLKTILIKRKSVVYMMYGPTSKCTFMAV